MTKTIKPTPKTKNTPKIVNKQTSMTQTPNVTVKHYQGKISDPLFTLTPNNIFNGLIQPLTKHQFDTEFFQKKALVIRSPPERIESITKDFMFKLNFKRMLQNADSENMHVWQKTKTGINSFQVEEVDEALEFYKDGASLYVSSSAEMRDAFCKQLQFQLGFGFSGYFPGTTNEQTIGDTMGEIETFIARKGHYTDWHLDFQENFTIQIKGQKKWRLKVEKGMEAPVVGYSPHYRNAGTLEMQDKAHLAYNKVNIGQKYDKNILADQCTEIILDEGDILYHPAGIWHSVESLSDSVSINFSLRQVRMADLVTNALRMSLLQHQSMRSGICVTKQNLSKQIESAFDLAKRCLALIKPQMIDIPKALTVPRSLFVDLDKPQAKIKLPKRQLRINPMFVIQDQSKIPQSKTEGFSFIVNGLFGNEKNESITRTKLVTKRVKTNKFLQNLPERLDANFDKPLVQHLYEQGLYY